jgi:hypothetical protein
MKTEKILIFTDTNKAGELDRNVEATQQGANDLIHIFESFQSYKKITSLDDFETLIADPLAMFDKTLQANSGINLEATGGKIPSASVLADLYDIDRNSYQAIVRGEKIAPGTCKKCGTLKVKHIGAGALRLSNYNQYSRYLYWTDNNRFEINESAVFEKLESFNYYIEDPASLEVYNFWHDLNNILNLSFKKGYLSDADLIEISKRLKNRLLFSYQSYSLSVNDQELFTEINSLKAIKLKN